jgi:hypothetical protein
MKEMEWLLHRRENSGKSSGNDTLKTESENYLRKLQSNVRIGKE